MTENKKTTGNKKTTETQKTTGTQKLEMQTTQIIRAHKSINFMSQSELLKIWIDEKKQGASYDLSNYIKECLFICYGQNLEDTAILNYNNILIAVLIDKCSYMLQSQLDININYDLSKKMVIFSNLKNLENNLTVKQKHRYNNYYDCKYGISQEEIKEDEQKTNERKQEELNARQSIYDAYGIPVELAQID